MLHLLLGTDWVANRDAVMDRIARDVGEKRGGRILLVPELISHDTERRLCAAAGDTASRYAEVLSFTRLARRVSETIGCGLEECLDNGGRVVAMAAAARQLHSKLKVYAALETRPEFLTELVDAVDEFKRCCISAQDLKAASEAAEGSLAQKLEELSMLLDGYDGLCQRGKRDPRDQMTWLLEQMESGDFGHDLHFYIDGFPDFTRQHLAVLEYLIQVCPSVTVSLNCDKPDSQAIAFEKAGQTAAELIRCAHRADVAVQIEYIEPDVCQMAPVHCGLFQGTILPTDAVTACRADSLYIECSHAAEKIMKLVRSGCRYRDIAVVCTDMALYRPVMETVFKRCKIPVYLSGTEEILQKSVVVTVLTAMDAALGGFDCRDVLRYLKSVLSPIDQDQSDQIENYAIIWGIRGERWNQNWTMHPDGLDGIWDDDACRRLQQLNDARAHAIVPLVRLCKGFQSAANLKQQTESLYAFLEEIQLAHRLDELASAMDAAGDNRSAQILNQLWEIILTALEQMHDVLGDTVWDAAVFTRLFQLLLSQYDVGTIPPVLDAVMAGPVSAMRCQQEKHLFVLGAEEGSLPGYGGSSGILNDQERVALRNLGVPLTGGAMDGLQAEFAEIYGVFCGARQSVSISYCGEQPSFVYRRLAQMAGGEARCEGNLGAALADPLEAGAYLVSRDAYAHAESLGLAEHYRQIEQSCNYDIGSVLPEHIRALYGKRLNLSASQIDRQAECRLSYFLKYGLRARQRKEATVDPAEFGTYVHAVLENTAREVMDLGGFRQVSLDQTLAIADKYSLAYAQERFSQLDSKRLTYLFRRNSEELKMVVKELWQELSQSEFTPVGFEVAFGEQADLDAIPVPGKQMDAVLRGFVDRVDQWQNYFRVVDYKTGKKDFDYCDVFNGVGLQMLLYLFALERSGEQIVGSDATPAGVQYFPARAPYLSGTGRIADEDAEKMRRKEWKRRGLLLHDEDVLSAMEPDEGFSRICATRRKDGTISGDVADRSQLRLLEEYIYQLIGSLVDDIASGNVQPNPYTRGASHSACAFCPYGAVCHKAQVEGRRNYKAMSADRFWEEVEKEVKRRG